MNHARFMSLRWMLLFAILAPAEVLIAGMTKNIEAVRPRIGQVGTTVEVTLQGVSLQNPQAVVFYRPGIRAIEIQPAESIPRRGLAHGGTIAEQVRCKFEIAPDCPLGEHPFRLLTSSELTCIGTFHVTPLEVIDEEESNNAYRNDTLEAATLVKRNVTVRGHLGNGAREDRDLYRLEALADERLSVIVESARIADQHYGDSEFDLALRILDQRGRVLASNDDNSLYLQDPGLSFNIPSDGAYFIEVRRSIFVPSETLYCLHLGDFPKPLAAYPPGGPQGTQQQVTWLGDARGDESPDVLIPLQEGTFEYFARSKTSNSTAPTPIKLRASTFPNLLEDSASSITKVPQLPVALNGIIDSPTDRDSYLIAAHQGERWHLRVFAASLGSPIDAAISIRRVHRQGPESPGSNQAAEVELDDSPLQDHDIFGTSFRGGGGLQEAIDPSVIWEPKADGDYELEVRDSSGAGGPTGIYRIEIESPRTRVQTYLASATFDWTESTRVTGLAIPRGNRWTIDVSLPVGQWNSFKNEIELIAQGLPEGVRLVPTRIKAGTLRWPLQFEADADARLAGTTFTLHARDVESKAVIDTRCQQNVPFINHPGGSAWRTVRTDRYLLGVTDMAPLSVDIQSTHVALVRGGESAVPVKITRQKGYEGAVEIRCGALPRSISAPPPILIPAGQSECLVQLGASNDASLEPTPLYVIASTVDESIDDFLGAGHVRVSSKLVDLTVSLPYLELAAKPESIRRGERKAFLWDVKQLVGFDGTAQVTLLGLPKGVVVREPLPTIVSSTSTIAFQLEATDEALLGQANGLSCEVKLVNAGQPVVQRTGKASLRIDPAAIPVVKQGRKE